MELPRALNVLGEIIITESIPVKALDLEDASNVENLDEDRQSDKSDVGCVNDHQEMHESVLCKPDFMEDTCTLSSAKTPFSLTKWWWDGLIDEAAKTSRL